MQGCYPGTSSSSRTAIGCSYLSPAKCSFTLIWTCPLGLSYVVVCMPNSASIVHHPVALLLRTTGLKWGSDNYIFWGAWSLYMWWVCAFSEQTEPLKTGVILGMYRHKSRHPLNLKIKQGGAYTSEVLPELGNNQAWISRLPHFKQISHSGIWPVSLPHSRSIYKFWNRHHSSRIYP